jgi:hypothetical protein
MNKHITSLLLLLFCGVTNLFAQNQQIGFGQTQINNNNYFTNKKDLAKISLKQDSILQLLKRNEQEKVKIDSIYSRKIAQIDSTYSRNIAQRDSADQELNTKYEALIKEKKITEERIEQLKNIIQIQKKGRFLPFGITQFKNNQKVLGYTFLISEIVFPIALGVGFERAANSNYKQYKHQEAQTLSEHNDYYKKYKNYHQAAIWTPIAAEVLIYGVNVLCNYYCPVKNKGIDFYPTLGSDHQGRAQLGLAMSFKF